MFERFKKDTKYITKPEVILLRSAAVSYKGEVFTATMHYDAFMACSKKFPNIDWDDVKEGYITSTGRFVDRNEANAIWDRQNMEEEENS